MIARVATEHSIGKLFDYSVPEELLERVRVGQRVEVPFRTQTLSAYVMELTEETPKFRLKSLKRIIEETPFFSPQLLSLARWMSEYFLAPLELVLKCILPAAVRNPNARAKEQFYVEAAEQLPDDAHPTKRQQELLDGLKRVGGGWLGSLPHEFGCSPETFRKMEQLGLVTIQKLQRRRNPLARRKILPTKPMALMDEQADALAQINRMVDEKAGRKPLLLFGVTGSGKTEVYLQAIGHVLEQGKDAIVMVPEISLTPQTVQRFASRFGDRIAVLHSALSDGERFDEWHRIRKGEAKVVVGPRSAVFAPLQNLGLIVVDEEHEPSYKQEDAPRYSARDVAVMRAKLEDCAVVLGTATPSMETWKNVADGKYAVAKMAKRVKNRPMPAVSIVDMRLEAAGSGHVQIFSAELLEALKLRLERGEQSILFLNRRGYATSLLCPKCGHVEECPDCSIAYTYHRADDCLRCHICGAWKRVPASCPECGDPDFKRSGIGTQRVELALQKCFPQARVLRMDADATSRKHSHDELLSIFRSGRADILIGTQMIAKGLDFPNVTLVGVLMADSSLNIPDFRAGERTFQLLAQVSGRSGRAEKPGEVCIQTWQPTHPAIEAAASDRGFEPFASQELANRAQGGYPPYSRFTCLTFKGEDESATAGACRAFRETLQNSPLRHSSVRVGAALPAALAKAKGFHRWQIFIFAPSTRAIAIPLKAAMESFSVAGVSLSVDVDALSL